MTAPDRDPMRDAFEAGARTSRIARAQWGSGATNPYIDTFRPPDGRLPALALAFHAGWQWGAALLRAEEEAAAEGEA